MEYSRRILILGASYGSLFAAKLLLAGYDVTLVCRQRTAELINREGIRVRLPVRGREEPVEIASHGLPGALSACPPEAAEPGRYDLVVLAMQEPHYATPELRQLVERVAASGSPVMSIMNMPPLPYLARLSGIDPDRLRHCYADATVWRGLDPAAMTLASPDPQAFRPPGEPPNTLRVTLPTNFKVARFGADDATGVLRQIEADIAAIRYPAEDGPVDLPVKLRVHDSLFVPLAKWAMLLTGNYRCVQRGAPRPIREAVHSDLEASRSVYDWVCALCRTLGASEEDLVPFEKYARAADGLVRPSSAAQALYAGATQIERVDRLVQSLAEEFGERLPEVDRIVALVDRHLDDNRSGAEPFEAVAQPGGRLDPVAAK